jgi:hypothetical protein
MEDNQKYIDGVLSLTTDKCKHEYDSPGKNKCDKIMKRIKKKRKYLKLLMSLKNLFQRRTIQAP